MYTFFSPAAVTLVLLARSVCGSPLDDRDLTPSQCSKIVSIVDALKIHTATPFCSSFLSIKPATSTSTVTITKTTSITTTSTITQGTPSTSIIFEPGNPPANKARAAIEDTAETQEKRNGDSIMMKRDNIPSYLTPFPTSIISSACECLSIPTPTTTTTSSTTKTSTSTIKASKTVTPKPVTSTYYPCQTPIPSLIPTIPYGVANQGGVVSSVQTLYGSNSPYDSLEGCCNACFFDIPNCIQAFYYFYEGCVVEQATTVNGTGVGISNTCPSGQIEGLTYSADTNPPFRSTGSIAGACGMTYNDLS